MKLAPSILSADFSRLGESVSQIERGGAHYIHVDVMDGHFVPNISFGAAVMKSLVGKTELPFDVHLMIEDPDRYVETFVKCGADLITVHAETTKHLHRSIQNIKSHGVKAAVALNPATPLSVLDYVLPELDMVLLMTVNPGFGGQKYIPAMTDKIRALRKRALELGLDLDIQVDGGINDSTIRTVLEAGANVCVAGSAVFGEHCVENAKRYLAIMDEYKAY